MVGSRWCSRRKASLVCSAPVGCVAHGARDADGAVVAQVAPDLADDHGHSVGGKAYIEVAVKIVDGFDKANTADLEQVVHRLAAPMKALDDREHEPEVAADQLFACRLVAPQCAWRSKPAISSAGMTVRDAVLTPQISTLLCMTNPSCLVFLQEVCPGTGGRYTGYIFSSSPGFCRIRLGDCAIEKTACTRIRSGVQAVFLHIRADR